MDKNTLMIEYAKLFIKVPYIWGGSHPCRGFDCSGLILEVLKSVGLAPTTDMIAKDIFFFLSKNPKWHPFIDTGSILFFGKGEKEITHIAIAINKFQMIEAGGGNHQTLTIDIAIRNNAFVRIRPISSRSDLISGLNFQEE